MQNLFTDYLNNDYRGMDLSRKTASGDFVRNFGSNISYNEQSTDMDGLLTQQLLYLDLLVLMVFSLSQMILTLM